jgi:hypothetical protein
VREQEVDLGELSADDPVTVWQRDGTARIGTLAGLAGGKVQLRTPSGIVEVPVPEVKRVTVLVGHRPEECLEYGTDCLGDVDLHWVGTSTKAWPRCQFHAARRQQRYEDSIERYADSDVPPDWFDPSVAGERWNEDD